MSRRTVRSLRACTIRSCAIALSIAVVASACASSAEPAAVADVADAATAADDHFGPTSDELNTIAIVERFGPSTAALAVTVAGQQMLPGGNAESALPDGVLPPMDVPTQRSSGSGFLIDVDGSAFVVSNFHVVQATLAAGTSNMLAEATIDATFPGHNQPVPLEVVGVNPSFDLALLRAADAGIPLPDAPPLPIADSDLVTKGQKTIAIGNPFGLDSTVTVGIVSSTGRFVPSIGEVSVPMIQTDAAINPGNSGGALINSSGELIGVNTAIFNPEARAFAGIGFAVPSNLLVEALANLELGGVSNINDTRPSFGAQLGTLSLLPEEVRTEAGLPASGVAVLDVAPGGPAEAAGLKVPEFTQVLGVPVPIDPDVIIAIDDRPVVTAEDLNLAISYDAEIGQEVELTVIRGGAEETIPVVLGGG